jgi:uncharacterized protein
VSSTTVFRVTTMLTWRAGDGHGFEGTRLLLGAGSAFRAHGRLVRADPNGDFTASYRLVVAEDGSVERMSVASATAQRERHLTINRTEEGFWLLDTGAGGTRTDFDGALDVDVAYSAMFNSLPIRRLGMYRDPGEYDLPMVYVSLPELEVSLVHQNYRTVRPASGDTPAAIEFRWDDFAAELVVDHDGLVISYPGIAERYMREDVTKAAS